MSKVDTIISELQAIAANPRKAMEDYKAATLQNSLITARCSL